VGESAGAIVTSRARKSTQFIFVAFSDSRMIIFALFRVRVLLFSYRVKIDK
jgi:hypothetical protein